jgi:hypothetical protein
LGKEFYLGTINVRFDEEVEMPEKVVVVEPEEKELFPVKCFQVRINGKEGWGVVPLKTEHGKEVLEVMTEKKFPDYSHSAVNLCNPPEVSEMMTKRLTLINQIAQMEIQLKESELYRQIEAAKDALEAMDEDIKAAIESYGSYQDTEQGVYAVRQRRVSVTYIPELVKKHIPDYAGAIIEEIVNKQKVGGLLKGGLISQEQVDSISETSESFAYIIK